MNATATKLTTFFAGSMIAAGILGAATGVANAAPSVPTSPNVSVSSSGSVVVSGGQNAKPSTPSTPAKTPIKLPPLPSK